LDFILQPVNDVVWYTNQVRFLRDHRYFTHSTRQLRDPGKQINLQELIRLQAAAQKADPYGIFVNHRPPGTSG